MKKNIYLICFTFLFLGFSQLLIGAPNAPNDYTDYLPKYRSQNRNFILTKIDYTSDKMILHFRYVAGRDGEMVRFSGASTATPWKLYASARGSAGMTKLATLRNIKVNNALKAATIAPSSDVEFMAETGEVVTGEAHFGKLPATIRSVNFEGGAIANCNDILIKEDGSPMLGNEAQMNSNVERFYNMLGNFGIAVVRKSKPVAEKKLEGIDFGKKQATPEPTQTKKEKAISKASKAISYTPKELTSAKDMGCNTRVILKNVYFGDNSADYAGRVEAMKTLEIVLKYLNYYPQSTIIW